MDRTPSNKRSLEQDDTPRKRSKATGGDEAARVGEVLRRIALDELGLSSVPPGAMVVPPDILASLTSMIQHAKGTVHEARALPNLPEAFLQQTSEYVGEIRRAVATVVDNAGAVAATCNQRADGGSFTETPKLHVVDKAELLAEEVCRHFAEKLDDLDDEGTVNDAISQTQSLIDLLQDIKRCQEERRKTQEERKRVERVLGHKVLTLKDLVVEAAYAYDNLGEERNRLLVDMYDMGVQTEYVVTQAQVAGRFTDKILELLRCPDAPPAVVVLEQLVESVIQELRLRLHLDTDEPSGGGDGGHEGSTGHGGSTGYGGYGEWSRAR